MVSSINPMYAAGKDRQIVDLGDCGLYGDNLKWILYSDGELEISGNGEMNWYYSDYGNSRKDTSLLAPWAKYFNQINVINIKEGVTSIGNDALVGTNIQYYRVNLPKSLKYFETLDYFGGGLFKDIKNFQPKGKHIAFCYAGSQSEWDAVECNHYALEFNELTAKYERIFLNTSISNRVEHIGFQDYQEIYFNSKEPEAFCKAQKASGYITHERFEVIDLFAHYYSTDEKSTLIWTVDGKSVFIDSETNKRATGNETKILFLGDTKVKLQLVSYNGDILSEDEIILKAPSKISFIDRMKYSFVTFLIIVIGTIGPWFSSLI